MTDNPFVAHRGLLDSTWASRGSTELTILGDGELLVSFGKAPGSEASDPDRAPFFVFCGTGVGPEGFDEAHVEGTPETWATGPYPPKCG